VTRLDLASRSPGLLGLARPFGSFPSRLRHRPTLARREPTQSIRSWILVSSRSPRGAAPTGTTPEGRQRAAGERSLDAFGFRALHLSALTTLPGGSARSRWPRRVVPIGNPDLVHRLMLRSLLTPLSRSAALDSRTHASLRASSPFTSRPNKFDRSAPVGRRFHSSLSIESHGSPLSTPHLAVRDLQRVTV